MALIMASSLKVCLTRCISECRYSGSIPLNIYRHLNNVPSKKPLLYNIADVSHQPLTSIRSYSSSFFTTTTAEQLWKGVSTVSNAGRQRGRKGRRPKDLNRGQIIGLGKMKMVWPGLNAPVIRGKEIIEQRDLGLDTERMDRLSKFREETTRRKIRQHPLERGWSGGVLGGRSLGPPDPVGGETFQDFDTRVLLYRNVTCMRGTGRYRRFGAFVVTGNKNGLAGFSKGKANDGKAALRQARNRAGQRLRYIERFEGHTVFHDFFTRFGATKIIVKKKPKGYGLICHRAIKTICELIGITDLYAKIEGSTNVINITKAFFLGLQKQKSHQQWADEMGMHLVEMRKEKGNYPVVVASPTPGKETCTIKDREFLTFQQIVMDGRIIKHKKKFQPFYVGTPSWERGLKRRKGHENLFQKKVQVLTEYGAYESFLTLREKAKALAESKSSAQQELE